MQIKADEENINKIISYTKLKEKGLSKEEIDKAVADFYDRNGVKRKKSKDLEK